MALVDWYILSMVCLAGAASPGPSWILLVNSVVKDGRKAGIAFGIAHGLGIFVYAALVAFGLMILISIAPWVSLVLEFIGLLFLLWLARSMIKNSFEINSVNDVGSDWMSRQLLEHARNGFLIVFLNPKIAAWTFALFSQFVKPNANISEQIILISTVGGIDALWYCLVATITSNRQVASKFKIYGKIIDLAMGIILVLLALKMTCQAI